MICFFSYSSVYVFPPPVVMMRGVFYGTIGAYNEVTVSKMEIAIPKSIRRFND